MSETLVAEKAKVEVARKEEPKKLPGSLERFSVRESSFTYPDIDVTMPVGHTLEDALKPEYWALHAHKMKKPMFSSGPDWSGAIIHLRTDDHTLYAQLYVRAVREAGLVVEKISATDLGPRAVKSDGYEPVWVVGKRGYNIVRKSDREIVASADKIKTKEDVQAWIDEARKAV